MISNSAFHSRTHRVFTAAMVAALGLGVSTAALGQAGAQAAAEAHKATVAPVPALGGVATASASHDPAALESANWAKMVAGSKGNGTHEGLKMHGHWVIDIKNPDGTLAEHRDFENALQAGGQGFLIGLMSGYLIPGDYMIVMGPSSGNGACVATYQWCGIVRSLSTYPGLGYCGVYLCATGLTYTYNFGTGFGGPFSMVLAGSITANQAGTIGSVYSLISTCANIGFGATNPNSIETSSPATCVTQTAPEPWYGPLSQTSIAPISVANGQIIQVTVTITFS